MISECPHCKVSLVGEEIPAEYRVHFGRLIACCSREQDACTHYECPDCGKTITREEAER